MLRCILSLFKILRKAVWISSLRSVLSPVLSLQNTIVHTPGIWLLSRVPESFVMLCPLKPGGLIMGIVCKCYTFDLSALLLVAGEKEPMCAKSGYQGTAAFNVRLSASAPGATRQPPPPAARRV